MKPTSPGHSLVSAGVAIAYVVLLSSGFVAIKVGVRYWPPLTLLAVRFLLAAALTAVLARASGAIWPTRTAAWIRLAIIGGLNMTLPATLNFLALREVSAGMAAIVLCVNPLLLTLVAPRLLGERLTFARVIGVLLGFGGVVYVMVVRIGADNRVDTPFGIGLLLAAAISMVGGTLVFKAFPPRETALVINTVQQLVGGVLLLPIGLVMERSRATTTNFALVASLVYLVVVVSFGAGALWFWLLARGEASAVSAFYFLSPISGLVLGTLFLNDEFGLREACGLVVICTGILLVRKRRLERV